MKPFVTLSIFLTLSLAGCTRKHEETPIPCSLPTTWKAPLPSDQTTPTVTKETVFTKTCARWWEVYKNDDLNKLVATACTENFSLKTYFHRVEEVLADEGIALSDLYPQITALADANRSRIPKSLRSKTTTMTGGAVGIPLDPFEPPPFTPAFTTTSSPKYRNEVDLGLQMTYEIDLWGKLSMRYAEEKERVKETQEEYIAARLSLTANLTEYFFRALYYTTQIELQNQKIKALDELIQIEKDRFLSGLVSEDTLLNYEQSREVELSQKENLLLLRSQAENRIALLIGSQPESFSLPNYPFSFQSPDLPSEIPSQVLLNRPDVLSLYSLVQANALEVDASTADLLPSLIIGPNFPALIRGPYAGFQSNAVDNLTKWKNHIWSLGANLSYTLFDGGRKNSIVKKNKALFLENLNQYYDRVLQAMKEVEDSLFSVKEARETLQNENKRYSDAKQSTYLSESRFSKGMAPKIEYLQSLIDLLTKEQSLHQRELGYLQASILLFTSIGGTWEVEKDPAQAV